MDGLTALMFTVCFALQLATIALLVRRPSAPAARLAETVEAEADEGEPTALNVLRHDHRFGPKDADGIRYCRCGDRYLDGMRV